MENTPLKLLSAHCNCDRLMAVPASHWPDFLSVNRHGESVSLRLKMVPGLTWFEGHFPGQPVLPGVVQSHWAGLLASALFDLTNGFTAMTRIKFKSPVLPGDIVNLDLVHVTLRDQINYRYHNESTEFSTGTLHFGGSA